MTSMTYSETGLESIPVGYRFQPTEEELLGHYLRLKMQGGNDYDVRAIGEVNIYNYEPWDLPGLSKIKSDDQDWFFFCAREIKYPNSNRSNRMTKKGYWKITCQDRDIKARGTKNVIGTKKTLVFHEGRVKKGVKTPWYIYQYQPVTFHPHEQAFVLCRLFKKPDVKTNKAPCDDGDVSRYAASDFEDQVPGHTIPEIHEFNQEDADLASLLQSPHQDYDFASLLQFKEYNQPERPIVDLTFTGGFKPDNNFANEQEEIQAPESSIKIYYDGGPSSDSDTDTAQAPHQQMHIIDSGTASLSNHGQYKGKRNGVLLDAFSVDSAADIRHAKDASRLSITTNLPQKEKSIMESEKEQKMAQGTNADNSPKLKKVRSAGSDRKGSLIFQETSQKGHESTPRSVYFVKILIGIFLFVVFIREMLLYGNWC
ncbi:hypothetical protein ACB094_06G216900 [Castanea mollissima]